MKMSAKQLTSFDRTAIATEILSRRFKPEFEKIEKREHAFARKMYGTVFSAADIKRMDELPVGWLPECKKFEVQIGAQVEQLVLSDPARMPYERKRGVLAVIDAVDKLADEFEDIRRDKADLEQLEKQTSKQVWAVLLSSYSLKALLDAWPEAAPYCGFLREKANLPAVPIRDLNRVLKLEEVKA
jgi:hypothetical protein